MLICVKHLDGLVNSKYTQKMFSLSHCYVTSPEWLDSILFYTHYTCYISV